MANACLTLRIFNRVSALTGNWMPLHPGIVFELRNLVIFIFTVFEQIRLQSNAEDTNKIAEDCRTKRDTQLKQNIKAAMSSQTCSAINANSVNISNPCGNDFNLST